LLSKAIFGQQNSKLTNYMRAPLISVLLGFFATAAASADSGHLDVLYNAPTDAAVEKWAHARGTGSRIKKFDLDGKEIIVALVDSCSGLACESIYVFVREKGGAPIYYGSRDPKQVFPTPGNIGNLSRKAT